MKRSESELDNSMDDILSESRLCWLGHVIRMDHQRIPRQGCRGGEFHGLREVQIVRVQTGGAQSTTSLAKDGNHMGGSRGGTSNQIRMVSECGPIHPLGCGLVKVK